MPVVYRLGDVYVLPSCGPGETWGLALNEAMASGRAVIAGSQSGGARDLVKEPASGWIFKSGDAADLARVLRAASVLGRDALRKMGRARARNECRLVHRCGGARNRSGGDRNLHREAFMKIGAGPASGYEWRQDGCLAAAHSGCRASHVSGRFEWHIVDTLRRMGMVAEFFETAAGFGLPRDMPARPSGDLLACY